MTDLSEYRRYYRTEKRLIILITRGLCPVCEMFVSSKYHYDCPYTQQNLEEDMKSLHSNEKV